MGYGFRYFQAETSYLPVGHNPFALMLVQIKVA